MVGNRRARRALQVGARRRFGVGDEHAPEALLHGVLLQRPGAAVRAAQPPLARQRRAHLGKHRRQVRDVGVPRRALVAAAEDLVFARAEGALIGFGLYRRDALGRPRLALGVENVGGRRDAEVEAA